MPFYYEKLLELKAIKKISDKAYLHVNFLFEKDLDMYLEVDEFTAENINSFILADEKYKYRLSFNYSFDVIKKQQVSTLTRTYLDHSEKMPFLCSEEYTSILTSIKGIQDLNDLDKLNFISKNPEVIHEEDEVIEIKQEAIEDIKTKHNIPRFLRLSFVGLVSLFLLFFGYLSVDSLNKTSINEKVLAESIQFDTEMNTGQNVTLTLDDNLLVEGNSLNQPIIPLIELDQTITYDLPKGKVALTFDDGPSKYSMEIVDVLKKYEIGATFFFIGKNAENHLDQVKYVQSNGYSIGSHSINHIDLATLSHANQEIELIQSIRLLEDIINTEINLFRPPYGSFTKYLKNFINENNYKMVLWNNDPEDWKTRDGDKIFDHIQNSDVSGSIILLHESQAVIDALPRIIEYLQELDLEIVNLK